MLINRYKHYLKVTLGLFLELVFSDTLTHSSSRRNTTSDHLQQTVNVFGTRPFLMLHDFNTLLDFLLLDLLSVSSHTDLRVVVSKVVNSQSGGVQTSQSNELPDVTQLTQSLDVSFLFVSWHSLVPVERWRKVVSQPLVWVFRLDTVSEFLGLVVVCSRNFPVEVDVLTQDFLSQLSGFLVRSVGQWVNLVGELGNSALLVTDARSVDLIDNSFVEQLQASSLGPFFFDLGQSVTVDTVSFSLGHQTSQFRAVWVGGTNNEVVVSVVNGRIGTQDISRSSDSNQSVDVFLDWDQDLTGHVTTLLGTWSLIFNVNTSGTSFHEHLGQLNDGSNTTVTSVSISDDWSQEVNVWGLGSLFLRQVESFLSLLSLVEKLSKPQVFNLVWNGVHWVVSQIRTWFVRGRSSRGTLPTRNVDGV